jgi:quercetin dioxygenase-like cupin family protein
MSLESEQPTELGWRWFAGVRVVVHVDAAQSDGRLGVWESIEPQGTALPLHVHHREDEQAVVLEGNLTFWVGDRVHHLGPGDTIALPRGVPHAHVITSPRARILTVATPGGFERLFTDLGTPVTSQTPPAGPPDFAAHTDAVANLGVERIGPPPSRAQAPPQAA